ncbi:MAG TPA: hypothetical protein DCF68_11880, partial [Cyanothece sp. UBA12306]|nr:hypothetical protein [Cyanothece sp. UBA12306]
MNLHTVSEPRKNNFYRYSKFNRAFLLSILGVMFSVGSFNFLVDPYDIYKTPKISGINQIKSQKNLNDRLFKTVDIIRIKPTNIMLGSSRTKQALNPDHPALSNIKPSYNLAIDGANVYELLRYLEHALKNQPELKQVVIGLDFFMFNEFLENQVTFSENRLEKQYIILPDLINSLFSFSTLELSKETIITSFEDPTPPDSYGENGFMSHRTPKDGKNQWRFKNGINVYFKFHHQYNLSQNYLSNFQKIVDICRKNNINLVLFISPSHATQWEAI